MQRSSSHVLDGVRILRASKVINESHELPTRLVDGKSHMESHHSDRQIWAQYQQLQAKLIMPQAAKSNKGTPQWFVLSCRLGQMERSRDDGASNPHILDAKAPE